MDFLIHRDELARALGRAQGIVEKRTTSPILSCALLQAQGDTLRITATDKTTTLISDHAATVRVPGEVAVDAANFFSVAKVLASDVVTVRLGEAGRLEVSAGTANYKLTTFPAAEFPVTPPLDQSRALVVEADALRATIDRTLFAVAPDDNRYGLNGAHLEQVSGEGGDLVRFVSTDGNRLCWAQAPFTGELGIGRKMLLPRKGLAECRKLLEGVTDPVTLAFGERAGLVRWTGLMVHLRLLEADFPDYRQVLPSSFKRRALLEKDMFTQALKRVAIFATDASFSVRFQMGGDGLAITARKLDAGDAREHCPMDFSGEPIQMGFNARFLLDVLGAIRGGRVSMELGDTLSPCIMRDPDADDALFVVMPVRLD
jgi:DNA polymerase-3 subunit beta